MWASLNSMRKKVHKLQLLQMQLILKQIILLIFGPAGFNFT